MKTAITSANGQLGSAIIKELKKHMDASEIIGISRSKKNTQALSVQTRQADYNNKESYLLALKDVEVLVLISGNDLPENRIIQHKNVINAAKEAGVRKIIYTSIYGEACESSFDPILNSNRQTEQHIKHSGLQWIIGRNGLYLDADLDALEDYKETGYITNSAQNGKCAYTSRAELAYAYSQLILQDKHNGKILNLCGEAISQDQLARCFNEVFHISLSYKSLSVNAYLAHRKKVYKDYFALIISGIYDCIRQGVFNVKSDFKSITAREHLNIKEMMIEHKKESEKKFSTISTKDLEKALLNKNTKVIDVRPVDAYNGWKQNEEQRGGHIKNAKSLPHKWLKYMDWIEIVRSKQILPENHIFIYSYTKEQSLQVAEAFNKAGYKHISIYENFIKEWSAQDNYPMEKLARYQQLVSANWLNQLITKQNPAEYNNKKYVICHAHYRNRDAYLSGHIPGAIDMDTLALEAPETWNRRSPEELKHALEQHGITAETTVILYGKFMTPNNDDDFPGSAAGHIGAIRNAMIMIYAGVKDVRILNGGYLSWVDAGFEVSTKDEPKTPVKDFGLQIPHKPHIIVDIPQAKDMIAASDADIVCVRSWPEYLGEVSGYNYIEKKGRIPGAVFGNCGTDAYHMENYRNVDHTIREAQEVAAIWATINITPDKHLAFYCGTGWRGSEAFFNAYLMGWPRVSVFDGGWFEWSNNPDNPFETGEPK